MAIDELKKNFEKEKKTAEEINMLTQELSNSRNQEEKNLISSQINSLKSSLKKSGQEVIDATESISLPNKLNPRPVTAMPANKIPAVQEKPQAFVQAQTPKKKEKMTELEKLSLKRLNRKEVKAVQKKEKKPSLYVKIASNFFYKYSSALINKGKFFNLRRDLVKANLDFVPENYVSVIFFSTLVSFFVAIFVTLFFLFFSLVVSPPFVVPTKDAIGLRFLKVFWILFAIPAMVYMFTYFYPSLEKKSIESRINNELPFATIHMSSISSAMLEPSKIFSIIISTGEYPYLKKEFVKLFNEVNIYGYDLVSALRNMAFNSPSRKLADLYNGLATTITSGGDLPQFFDKRAQTLLFDHRIESEKQSKAAETFMDIYISVVIAAPMILMLLLVMMRVSGLGISLSTQTITLVMVLSVSLLNLFFLVFLHIKQPEGG